MPSSKFFKKSTASKKGKYPAKNYKRTYRKSSSKKLINLIKKVSLSTTESKHIFIQAENIQLYHNTPLYNSNLLACSQGTQQINRLGDEVVAKYLNLKIWLTAKLDRPNVMFRVVVYTTPLTYADLTKATGASGNWMITTLDTDKCKIIKQLVFKTNSGDYSLESGATNKECSVYKVISINLKNRKVKYQLDGGSTVRDQHNYINFAVIAYDTYGSLITDNIASFSWQSQFIFKDP